MGNVSQRTVLLNIIGTLTFTSSTVLVCFGQGPSSVSPASRNLILEEINRAIDAGDAAVASKNLTVAQTHYADAVTLSRKLPDAFYALKAEALKKLAEVDDYEKDFNRAETLLNERLSILGQHSESADLQIGLALFDLETHYGIAPADRESGESCKARRGLLQALYLGR